MDLTNMNIFNILMELFSDYTMRTVALGAACLGIVSGSLGTFALLRRQSLLGDAISHAALPGIALAFLLTGTKNTLVLMMGAGVAGWIATLCVMGIIKNTVLKDDTALGLILSVFFGIGLVLLTYIQKMPNASQAGLDTFLFGQAAALLEKDIVIIAILGIIVLSINLIFWKELKVMCFDPEFGKSLGFPVKTLDIMLVTLLVVAIILGLQTVGVILMSALIISPAAAARQWTNKLGVMVGLSALFGAVSGISGSLVSSSMKKLPTGPVIVVCMSVIVFISLFFAPNRGLLWQKLKSINSRKQIKLQAVLSDLYCLYQQHNDLEKSHHIDVMRAMSQGHGGTDKSLTEMQKKGWAFEEKKNYWKLTGHGLEQAQKINKDGGQN